MQLADPGLCSWEGRGGRGLAEEGECSCCLEAWCLSDGWGGGVVREWCALDLKLVELLSPSLRRRRRERRRRERRRRKRRGRRGRRRRGRRRRRRRRRRRGREEE